MSPLNDKLIKSHDELIINNVYYIENIRNEQKNGNYTFIKHRENRYGLFVYEFKKTGEKEIYILNTDIINDWTFNEPLQAPLQAPYIIIYKIEQPCQNVNTNGGRKKTQGKRKRKRKTNNKTKRRKTQKKKTKTRKRR
jgi:hypothetical protein